MSSLLTIFFSNSRQSGMPLNLPYPERCVFRRPVGSLVLVPGHHTRRCQFEQAVLISGSLRLHCLSKTKFSIWGAGGRFPIGKLPTSRRSYVRSNPGLHNKFFRFSSCGGSETPRTRSPGSSASGLRIPLMTTMCR